MNAAERAALRSRVHGITAGIAGKVWQEWQHPRDKNGQFIEKGATVNIGKKRGKIIDLTREGAIVEVDGVNIKYDKYEMKNSFEVAPESVARIDPAAHPAEGERVRPSGGKVMPSADVFKNYGFAGAPGLTVTDTDDGYNFNYETDTDNIQWEVTGPRASERMMDMIVMLNVPGSGKAAGKRKDEKSLY